jgi:hypothetical protein
MTITHWKWLFNITIILVLLTTGFFIGRKTVNTKTEIVTEYIKGETITDTVYYPKPYKVVEPIDTLNLLQQCIKDGIYKELWPERVVTEYVEMEKKDTTAIIKDWATKRFYSETLFSDEKNGTCIFNAEVQYNRMNVVGYSFTPSTKVITEKKHVIKTFSPFVGVNYLTNPWNDIKNPSIQLNGGLYINEKYGLQLIYQRGFKLNNDYLGGGILIKF